MGLRDLIAPPRCGACGEGCEAGAALCRRCRDGLRAGGPLLEAGPPGVDLLIAAAGFDGAARGVVHGLKFDRRLGLARVAAEAIARAAAGKLPPGALVPVPPSPFRWRWRGFDPAEEIAIALPRLTGAPLHRCLARRGGPRQVGRPRAERLTDPPRVRLRRPPPPVALLVDDVCTTGATLEACAAALRSGGARSVVALVLARAEAPGFSPCRGGKPGVRFNGNHPTEGGRP